MRRCISVEDEIATIVKCYHSVFHYYVVGGNHVIDGATDNVSVYNDII